MSHILHIAGNVLGLVLVAGFVGWVLFRSLKRSDDPAWLVFKWILTAAALYAFFRYALPMFGRGGFEALGGLILALIIGIAMTITWRHSITDLVANPIASLYDGGKEQIEPKPYYTKAIGRRKMNHPLEAIVEIRNQLAKFPDDYEGVMLLASIQAEDMQDLPSAEMTLNHFCNRPEAPPAQVAAALTQMADWHLRMAQDTDSARTLLEKIIERFPKTTMALQAAQRIAHLGGVANILLAAHDRQAIPVPEGVQNIGLLDSTEFLRPKETDPAKLTAELVKHLEAHPLDTDARERLAILYARHYHRLDMATLELEQLINEPDQPAKRVAHWLNLLADLQIHEGADYDIVRETLEKIGERFPGLPVAELAQSRLNILKLEIKGHKKEAPNKTLGVYEQNIGLKYGSPRQL